MQSGGIIFITYAWKNQLVVRTYRRNLLILWLFVFIPSFLGSYVHAKIPFMPQITNYSVNQYKAGNQNWAICEGPDGKMYIGNNRGLLIFDGVHWDLVKLPNGLGVRAIYISKNNRIYIGSFDEFGYFESNENNEMSYHSLSSEIASFLQNEEFWTINEFDGKIYFQSFRNYFIYDGDTVEKADVDRPPLYIFLLGEQMYIQFMDGPFCRLQHEKPIELIPYSRLKDVVVAIFPYKNKLLLATSHNGFYIYDEQTEELREWNIPAGKILSDGVANRGIMLSDSTYIVGTISNGIVAVDKQGTLLWHINQEKGLINNTILRLAADHTGNLWAAMDNGIACIQVGSPLFSFNPSGIQIGMVHDMLVDKETMYLATNQGLYAMTEEDESPMRIPGTEEQTWFIQNVGNQLIAGHNKGTLLIEGKKATVIPGPNDGGTVLRKCILHGKEILLQMSYRPLSVFVRNESNRWVFSHHVEGFSNLIKSFEVDPTGNIWASHMYKGIYRVRLNEALNEVVEMDFIDRLSPNHESGTINVMKLRGRIVFSDGKNFYTFEDLVDKIVPYDLLNNEFRNLSDTYRIVPLNNDLYWFIRNSEYVLLGFEEGKFRIKLRIPFTKFKNPTIEDRGNIFVDNDGNTYFCLNGGVARYRKRTSKDNSKITFTLSSVKAFSNDEKRETLLPCSVVKSDLSAIPTVDYTYNSFTFRFSYPDYSGNNYYIFYKLDGYDKGWISGSADLQQSYPNLPFGQFVLHAQVRDDQERVLASIAYPFEIEHPFYLSWWALILYFLLFIFVLYILIRTYTYWILLHEKKANEAMQMQQEEQLKRQEQMIFKLQNEKLENDLTYKSKELASKTLSLISQKDFLENLKKEIQAQQLAGSYSKRFLDKLLLMIDENTSTDDEWAVFQANFDRLHEHFFVTLKEQYPDLSPGDLRMSALLRLNLSTKDIARIQNLTIRGVETARYRLRRKLNLPESQSLVDFMLKLREQKSETTQE